MILRWLNSLGGRVSLSLFATLIVAQVVSVFILVENHENDRAQEVTEGFFRDIQGLGVLMNSSADVDARLAALSHNGFQYWVSAQPTVAAEYRDPQPGAPPFGRAWTQILSPDKRARWFPDARPFWMHYRFFDPEKQPPPGDGPQAGQPPPGGNPPPARSDGSGFDQRADGPPQPGVSRSGFESPGFGGPAGFEPGGPGPDGFGPGGFGPGGGPGPNVGRPNGPPPGPGGAGYGPPPRGDPPRALPPGSAQRFGEATPRSPHVGPGAPPVRWRVSLKLDNGQWLNAEYFELAGLPPWINVIIEQNAIILVMMALSILFVVGFATKRLGLLASAADRVGRGETLEPIPESGTSEVRQLTQSFNTMSLRLRRFIEARTQMLGAISHDLRTPITGLKLRAELVEDEENRERMLAICDEIHHLTQATLALAKDDSFTEVTDRVDISSMIEAICDDLTDVGIDVSCEVARGVKLNCRPFSLRRAIRNLAENGAKYGHRSRIHMQPNANAIQIIIDDDGPGIPEDQLDRVLLPFVRLETSRSRETGGAGLGLAITRSIVLNHGGELELKNRAAGGLRATITLPIAA